MNNQILDFISDFYESRNDYKVLIPENIYQLLKDYTDRKSINGRLSRENINIKEIPFEITKFLTNFLENEYPAKVISSSKFIDTIGNSFSRKNMKKDLHQTRILKVNITKKPDNLSVQFKNHDSVIRSGNKLSPRSNEFIDKQLLPISNNPDNDLEKTVIFKPDQDNQEEQKIRDIISRAAKTGKNINEMDKITSVPDLESIKSIAEDIICRAEKQNKHLNTDQQSLAEISSRYQKERKYQNELSNNLSKTDFRKGTPGAVYRAREQQKRLEVQNDKALTNTDFRMSLEEVLQRFKDSGYD